MNLHDERRVVLTLDAGGTNFVFSAMRDGRQVVEPVTLPAVPDDSRACLQRIADGFRQVKEVLDTDPVAISFAFPGPADYAHGVIGDLPNFPGFRGGVALGPYLEDVFGIPVFIENDGNLFALGEALYGALPAVNEALAAAGSQKRYRNLLGLTLGTGFGAGVVLDGRLLVGDNGCGGDVWLMRHPRHRELIVEEGVSIRAVKRRYARLSGEPADDLTPKDIFDIAEGRLPGDAQVARSVFADLGRCAAEAIVPALDIVDGIVVIGGGLSGASRYFLPGLLNAMRANVATIAGASFPCLQMAVYDLGDPGEKAAFLRDESGEVSVPGTDRTVRYETVKKTGVMISSLGASRAIALGAYSRAIQQLD